MKKPGYPEELKVRVDAGLRAEIAQAAAAQYTSLSEIIRRAIRQSLAQQRRGRGAAS